MDSEWLLIALTSLNGYVSQNTDTACWYTKTHFMKFVHLLVGGQHIPAGLPYPPPPQPNPSFWSSDCLQLMKWLLSITLLKMMKFSYNPNIFCLFTLISQLKYLRWQVGGKLSQLVYLAAHPDFWAVIGYGLWIAVNYFSTINGYVAQNTDTASIQKNISWNLSICWWGATYPSWFTYPPPPPPTQDFGAVTVYT